MGRRERRHAHERLESVRADWRTGHLLLEGALRAGDLDEIRAVFDDGSPFPNVEDPMIPVSLLVRAIDVAPLGTIEALLGLGADPNHEEPDGFPSLHAVITSARDDRVEVIGLLLESGADPDQRGFNDYTALHAAAAQGDETIVDVLLAAGADPAARCRIDDLESPAEVAGRAGHTDLAARLATLADRR